MGYKSTVAAAVHDGYLLQKSVSRSRLGGEILTDCMQRSVESKVSARPAAIAAVRRDTYSATHTNVSPLHKD